MAEARSQFTFYESFFRALSRIRKKADRADAFDAICNYALYGIEPDLGSVSDAAAIAFDLIRPNLDASKKKAESGKRGGESKHSASKTETNAKQSASEKEKEKEIEKENECYNNPPLSPSAKTPPVSEPDLAQYGFSDALAGAVSEWLQYKRERRETYKPTGQKALLTEIRNNADRYGEDAVCSLIRSCMASNWQGIIFDRLKTATAQRPQPELEPEYVLATLEDGRKSWELKADVYEVTLEDGTKEWRLKPEAF